MLPNRHDSNITKLLSLFSLILIEEASAQVTDYFPSRKMKVPFSMAIGHGELMHECFPNTHAWKQQERNKTKRQTKTESREA